MTKKGCAFCGRFDRSEFDGYDSRDDVMWFEPLNPVTPGHMLFIPGRHIEHDDLWAYKAVGQAMEAAHFYAWSEKIASFNLITSYGAEATQTVPHIHIHLVPRRSGDGLQLPWGLPHG